MDWTVILFSFLIVEIVTLFCRFVLNLRSRNVYRKLKKKLGLKKILHFHHGYFGIILMIISISVTEYYLFEIGAGLVIADLFHHFAALKLITGKSDFYVFHR